jgi:hypothetical protein
MEQRINKRTSIDFPQSSYDYITKMIVAGKEKSMRDMLLKLLSLHRAYDIGSWRIEDGVLQTHMVRFVVMSDVDMEAFEDNIPSERRHDIGLTIGKMWAEAWAARARTWDGDLRKLENWSYAVDAWKYAGWGRLDFNPRLNRIFAYDSVFSPETIAGVLEGLIGRNIKPVKLAYPERASKRIYTFDLGPPVSNELASPVQSAIPPRPTPRSSISTR